YHKLAGVLRVIKEQQRLGKLIVSGQNWKFDQSWLATFTGVDLACDFDTMLASHACDENQQHGLEEQAARIFGAEPWDIPLEEKQGGTSLKKLSIYAGWDVYWTRSLTRHWKKELAKDPILEKLFYALRIKSSNLLSRVERNGTYVDPKKILEGKKYW